MILLWKLQVSSPLSYINMQYFDHIFLEKLDINSLILHTE